MDIEEMKLCCEFFMCLHCFYIKIGQNEPSIYVGSGKRFLKARVDTGVLLSVLWDSILWYGRVSDQRSTISDQRSKSQKKFANSGWVYRNAIKTLEKKYINAIMVI